MLSAPNIAVQQDVIEAPITIALLILYLHASDVHQHSMFNHRGRAATLLWGTDFRRRPATNLSRI